MKKITLLILLGFLVASCKTLQFQEVNQNIKKYDPKSVVILPFSNSMGMENANDVDNNIFAQKVMKEHLVQRVIEPGQVKAQMAENDKLLTAITTFKTKWVATGFADKAMAKYIGETLNAESIIFGEISQWSAQSAGSKTYYRAGVTMRWVNASDAAMLWKVSHNKEREGGGLLDLMANEQDQIKNVMEDVLDDIVANWPTRKK